MGNMLQTIKTFRLTINLSKKSNKYFFARRVKAFAEASFIGSQANKAIVVSTTTFLAAGRFGLAPSANKPATSGLKLKTTDSGLKTNDPAAFTAVDTLAFGAMGHIVGVGIYLGTVGTNPTN